MRAAIGTCFDCLRPAARQALVIQLQLASLAPFSLSTGRALNALAAASPARLAIVLFSNPFYALPTPLLEAPAAYSAPLTKNLMSADIGIPLPTGPALGGFGES